MKMELKDALESAIKLLESVGTDVLSHDLNIANCHEAARLLRDGSDKVEHSEPCAMVKCCSCRNVQIGMWECDECGSDVHAIRSKWYTRTYTTHQKIKIETVTSEPRFVEIGDCDE